MERPGVNLDPDLLDRYVAGEATEAETARVRRWLMANPDAARRLAAVLQGLDRSPSRPPMPVSTADSWRAIAAQLDAAPQVPNATPLVVAPMKSRWSWRAAAAALLLAGGIAGGVAVRVRRPDRVAAIDTTLAHTFATARRERSEFRLPDGTRVRLAPGSRLRLAADFGAGRRDVSLDGEAFFEVVHDARRPFTVHAGRATARDIGTSFSVRAYATDSAVVVTVREGEVALSGAGHLRAGDVGRVTHDGQGTVKRGVHVDSLLGWMEGRLAYTDAPLGTVLDDLHRWYDVDVRLGDATIAVLPFTGTLTDVPPQTAVELVAATLGLRVQRDGVALVLFPTPGRTPTRAR